MKKKVYNIVHFRLLSRVNAGFFGFKSVQKVYNFIYFALYTIVHFCIYLIKIISNSILYQKKYYICTR